MVGVVIHEPETGSGYYRHPLGLWWDLFNLNTEINFFRANSLVAKRTISWGLSQSQSQSYPKSQR